METQFLHSELIARKQQLEQLKSALREKFLGLDEIIDDVISLMLPWYLFPTVQRRPTVINLWGLTGSGKTALVQAIVEILEYKRLYTHIDMGEFDSDSASWMKSILTDDLDYFHEKPAVLCLDEFQFARTLDANSNELGKDKLRVLWDLLDSGKIEYIPSDSIFYLYRADNCLRRLQQLIGQGVVLENGIIVQGMETFVKVFDGFFFDYQQRGVSVPSYFMGEGFIGGLVNLFDDEEHTKDKLRSYVKTATIEELIVLVKKGMHRRPASKTLDLSRSLIFVLGNLDEAYSMSHNMNPDISADEFYEATSKITIADIKRALRKRFRPEQIARLGNNHIIYRSFSSAHFRMLIRQELKRTSDFVLKGFGWTVTFDESVVGIVYAEGVFPAQGTRPVLTTLKNLIESRVSSLAVSLLEYQLKVKEIVWKYSGENFIYQVKDESGNELLMITDPAKLKIENLRKSVDPQIQAHTAVHEAGHAVLAALTLKIIPAVVTSRTASDSEGFCLVNFPKGPMTKETLKKDIVITLGGYVAEKMIFGDEMTCSGVYSDIEEASRLANRAVRNYAMGSDPIRLAVGTQNEDAFVVSERYSIEAVQLIRSCEAEAERLLERNKLLLLKVAEYLTTNSRMEEEMIGNYVRKYAAERWVENEEFLKKENYYQFNTVLQTQLAAKEAEIFNSSVEQLISGASTGCII